MSDLIHVIERVAELAKEEDYVTTAEASIEEILSSAPELDGKPRPLFVLKMAVKEKLGRNWNEVLNQNGPRLVDLCVECVSAPEETKTPTEKKPKEKKATKRSPKKAKPKKEKEEPKKEEPPAPEEDSTKEESIKRKPKRRKSAKTPKPDVEKEPKEVKKAPKQEAVTGVSLADIKKLHEGMEQKVGNAMATILEDNKRTREMVQDLWTQQRNMLLDENYIPPEILKGWND